MLSYIKKNLPTESECIQNALNDITYSAIHGKSFGKYLYSYYDYDTLTLPHPLTPETAPKIIVYSYSDNEEVHRYGEVENITKIAFGSKYHVSMQKNILRSYTNNSDGSINFDEPVNQLILPFSVDNNNSLFYSNDEKYVLCDCDNYMIIVRVKNGVLSIHSTKIVEGTINQIYFLKDNYLCSKGNIYTIVSIVNKSCGETVAFEVQIYTMTNDEIVLRYTEKYDHPVSDISVDRELKRVCVVSDLWGQKNQILFYRLSADSELEYLCGQTVNAGVQAVEYGPHNYISFVYSPSNKNDYTPIGIGKIADDRRSFFMLSDIFVLGRNTKYTTWTYDEVTDECMLYSTSSLASGTLMPIYLASKVLGLKFNGKPYPRYFGDNTFCQENSDFQSKINVFNHKLIPQMK